MTNMYPYPAPVHSSNVHIQTGTAPMQPIHHASSLPVITQPVAMQQSTTVMQQTTNVNTGGNPMQTKRMWSTSLVDCFQDVPSCLLGCICPCLLTCWVASRAQETCCIGCFLRTAVALRTKIRIQHNIQGSICDDCVCIYCLSPLVLCQMHRELNHLGYV